MPEARVDREKCKGCGLCVDVCRRCVLTMSQETNSSGYRPSEVADGSGCTGCTNCALICPDVALTVYR